MQRRSENLRRRFTPGFQPGTAPPPHGRDRDRLEILARLREELELERELHERRAQAGERPRGREAYPRYPTSGDPNIIGEHEVAPVLCPCCNAPLPWPLIKGWRD